MNVGRAARVIRPMTGSPESIEYPKSPWKTPFVAPDRGFGRKFGRPLGPMKTPSPSPSGLQIPIQRQYWTGIG